MKCLASFLMQKCHEAKDVAAFVVTTPENDLFTIELQRPSVKRVARVDLRRRDPESAATLSRMFDKILGEDWPDPVINFEDDEPEAAKEGGENVEA